MDTDSLYMAISTPIFEEAVEPDMKKEFYQEWTKWFPSQEGDRPFFNLSKEPLGTEHHFPKISSSTSCLEKSASSNALKKLT